MANYIWSNNVTVRLKSNEYYRSKEDVLEQIKENEERINQLKQELFGLCCGNPKELLECNDCEGNPLNPIEVLTQRFETLFKEEYSGIEYLIAHNVKLQYIADNWDSHQIG